MTVSYTKHILSSGDQASNKLRCYVPIKHSMWLLISFFITAKTLEVTKESFSKQVGKQCRQSALERNGHKDIAEPNTHIAK